jgi:hypothetical protein
MDVGHESLSLTTTEANSVGFIALAVARMRPKDALLSLTQPDPTPEQRAEADALSLEIAAQINQSSASNEDEPAVTVTPDRWKTVHDVAELALGNLQYMLVQFSEPAFDKNQNMYWTGRTDGLEALRTVSQANDAIQSHLHQPHAAH